jgi:hypothetical protein
VAINYRGPGGSGTGGGPATLPSTSYGVIDPRWPRTGRIELINDALAARGMAGLSSFGSATTIFPSSGNELAGTSVLTATPRVFRQQDTFPACGCGEELANGQSLRARDGYHLVWIIGGLDTRLPADGFAGIGALSAIDTSDLASLPGQAMLCVSDVELETPGTSLDLVVVPDTGVLSSVRIAARPDDMLIFEVFARPSPTGDCEYMQLRLYNAETRTAYAEQLVLTNAAAIPQGFVSPFALLNRGTGTSSFHCAGAFFGAGVASPAP